MADLGFTVRRSARRTVELVVERDGRLTVAVPTDAESADIVRIVEAKLDWVYQKLARKNLLLNGPPPPKEYVPGEGFWHLGRSYRLRIISPPTNGVKQPPLLLRRGWFELTAPAAKNAEQHFRDWYLLHAHSWIGERIKTLAPRMGVEPTAFEVRSVLGHRWGSCTPDGRLLFHWRIILLPARYAEYVIVHELAHLKEPNHGPNFWRVIELIVPDWRARKEWLAANGSRYYL
ncbi:metal-dependent hydrolase [Capsulimonas corticalis]|uniref:Metal-dependent hydrolase n=1 Tax=Capsulimonas corticalis TaxID=2219043 RepID=A0A402CVS6_9BACT|nr:metal-dependent hydrolase [Capsulimonas corticalis]